MNILINLPKDGGSILFFLKQINVFESSRKMVVLISLASQTQPTPAKVDFIPSSLGREAFGLGELVWKIYSIDYCQ